ncbi:hypothetical protein AB0N59_04595 [Microbacterium sp. NPDC089321]|uniref:hypothetical protein n=1 Tax=Microbacterium sp. NPDC089321 TaxID=3155183 RepID=UPI00341245CE
MSEQNAEDLSGLDEAMVERPQNGTATRADEIAKLQQLRDRALEQGDADRVEQLDMRLSVLRLGE